MQAVKFLTRVATAAIATVSFSVSAATFTFDPSAIGLNGGMFTADTLNIADFATVTNTASGFTETGFLSITSASLGGATLTPSAASGLNSSYGLYVAFTASGTQTYSNPSGPGSVAYGGTIDSLSYSFYAYSGVNTFTPEPSSAPANSILLGSGSLVQDTGFFDGKISLSSNRITSASAVASLTFDVAAGSEAFFTSPNAASFFNIAEATFANVGSQILTQYSGGTISGFTVRNGGGSIAFVAAPVPEPETYAMMAAGLGLIGGLAMRRRAKKQG